MIPPLAWVLREKSDFAVVRIVLGVEGCVGVVSIFERGVIGLLTTQTRWRGVVGFFADSTALCCGVLGGSSCSFEGVGAVDASESSSPSAMSYRDNVPTLDFDDLKTLLITFCGDNPKGVREPEGAILRARFGVRGVVPASGATEGSLESGRTTMLSASSPSIISETRRFDRVERVVRGGSTAKPWVRNASIKIFEVNITYQKIWGALRQL
jgi:hypothetical protein